MQHCTTSCNSMQLCSGLRQQPLRSLHCRILVVCWSLPSSRYVGGLSQNHQLLDVPTLEQGSIAPYSMRLAWRVRGRRWVGWRHLRIVLCLTVSVPWRASIHLLLPLTLPQAVTSAQCGSAKRTQQIPMPALCGCWRCILLSTVQRRSHPPTSHHCWCHEIRWPLR